MSGAYEKQKARVKLPRSTTKDTFPAAGVNTGGLSLVSFQNEIVSISLSQPAAVRAGSTASVAATANDYPLQANVDYSFRVEADSQYLSVRGLGTGGNLFVAKTS